MSLPLTDLPAVVANDDSLLTQKYGKETINYFSWSNLNRLSFLRTDHPFLGAAFSHPDAKFLVFNDFAPLMATAKEKTLLLANREDVISLTGPEPFKDNEAEMIQKYDSTVEHPLLVFLGVLESETADFVYRSYRGSPFFVLDLTPRGSYVETAKQVIEQLTSGGAVFNQNMRNTTLHLAVAGWFAQARTVVDWNLRNRFCASCGSPTLAVNAGYKRVCPPTDFRGTSSPQPRPECPSRTGITNLSFPRTDSVMIAAIVSSDGKRVLLGRQKRWPPHWYSTLAGFIEPGESVEEAVRREVWEESGVKVGRVVLHSSQPWPFPSNLMLGAIGQALAGEGEKIDLGNDPELEHARWFEVDEVREALKNGVSGLGMPPPPGYKEGGLRLPPDTAIANQLLQAVVDGFVTGGAGGAKI